ncbi:MAG: tRNA pseudouridine(55) synthase TruB [Eubacteriales bacterium]|nr:tRNA pseudouridine(55) synthase TruB [Eubacteriales bacterium]
MQFHYNYNGFLNVYKEAGWTSMDVCAKLKRITGVRKIGHAGTLDPMAEGVLPVAIGIATKNIDLIGGKVKEYRAGMLLGTVTDTEDITGNVTGRYTGELPGEEAVREAVMSFVGAYEQLTPMYSARKVNGRKLYEYARAGVEVERKTKPVSIYEIRIEEISVPHVVFTVKCSQGTYIRSLCRDIGEKLGCGACMSSLLRTQVGDFRAEDAVRISDIEAAADSGGLDSLLRVTAPTAVAIGKFDGAHIGHQALFRELRRAAERDRLKTLVLILRFGKSGIMSREDRKQKLAELGIDYCIELDFTDELKNMSAEDFLSQILIGRFNMKTIVAGKDVSFGRNKAGNAEFLHEHASEYGYKVDLIDKVTAPGGMIRSESEQAGDTGEDPKKNSADNASDRNCFEVSGEDHDTVDISSTMLRGAISKGDMELAARLLGEPYSISGYVVHGKGIASSKMKYPTMNIEVSDDLNLPPFGVYAVRACIYPADYRRSLKPGKEIRPREIVGIANLGERPTVNGSTEGGTRLRLEIHSFDDIGNCYESFVKTELCRFIRPEKRFSSVEELTRQISGEDIPAVQKYFGRT